MHLKTVLQALWSPKPRGRAQKKCLACMPNGRHDPIHASTPKRSLLHRLVQRPSHWVSQTPMLCQGPYAEQQHLRASTTMCPWGPYAEQRHLRGSAMLCLWGPYTEQRRAFGGRTPSSGISEARLRCALEGPTPSSGMPCQAIVSANRSNGLRA